MDFQFSRSHWFFEPWNVLVSSSPHLILEPLKLLALASWILGSPTLGLPILESVRDRAPSPPFLYGMLGQTHMNGWSHVIASQNGGLTSYISLLRLGVLQWSRHLFNYWKNKKTIIEKFLILLI